MGPVETYLSEMCELRSARAGVKEITYYTALANLLDEVGKTLKPRVRCVLQLQNRGAGNPDGGLFTADLAESHLTRRLFVSMIRRIDALAVATG